MKLFIHFLAAAMLLALTGCIIPEKIETRVRFIDKNTSPQITIIWHNISSPAENDEELKKDFDDLIEDLDKDNALTGAIGAEGEALLIKDWQTNVEDGKIHLQMSGVTLHNIFGDIVSNGERMLILDMESGFVETTNGKLFQTDRNYIIVWPETQKELYWSQRLSSDSPKRDKSEWERWKQNRPKLIKMFEAYHQKRK